MTSEEKIRNFEIWCRETIEGVSAVKRWSKKDASRENVLEHMFKTVLLAWKLLGYEMLEGNPHYLSRAEILFCAATHDIGEGVTGIDHPAPQKTKEDEKEENHAYEKHIRCGIPEEICDFFPLPIDQDSANETHKRFWCAVEELGYLYFALGELQEEEEEAFSNLQRVSDFFHVSNSVRDTITRLGLADEFKSVKKISNILYAEIDRLEKTFLETGQALPPPNK